MEPGEGSVLRLPFNRFVGIEPSQSEQHIFRLNANPNYLNHLGTVHASAQFALAEATSGEVLLDTFSDHVDEVIPILRRAEVKYRAPGSGTLYSSGVLLTDAAKVHTDIATKGRALISVEVTLYTTEHTPTMTAQFEWFVQRTNA